MADDDPDLAPSAPRADPGERLAKWLEAFGRHYDQLTSQRRISDSQLASEIGVSRAAFSNWRARSVPKESLISQIALVLANRNPARAHEIEADLRNAISSKTYSAGGEPPLLRAQIGKEIRIDVVEYGAFNPFFKTMGETLLRFSGVTPRTQEKTNLSHIRDRLSGYESDIAASVFATPARLKTMRFITTPIKIGVAKIAPKRSSGPVTGRPTPIVNDQEVGYAYARYILETDPEDLRPVPYQDDRFARKFYDTLEKYVDEFSDVPFVYVDEVMAMDVMVEIFRILIEEAKKGRLASRGEAERLCPWLVLESDERSEHPLLRPRYNLSFATYRQEPEWHDYLAESWNLFAHSNADYIAHQYVELYRRLNKQVELAHKKLDKALEGLGKSPGRPFIEVFEPEIARFLGYWAQAILRWVRFDGKDPKPPPWKFPGALPVPEAEAESSLAYAAETLQFPWEGIVSWAAKIAAEKSSEP